MLFVFPSQKDFVLAFRRGEVPSGAERFTPTDSPANFPEDPPILPIDSAIEPKIESIPFSSFPAGIALFHQRCLNFEVIERCPIRAHHNRVSLRGGQIHVHRVTIRIDLHMQKRFP